MFALLKVLLEVVWKHRSLDVCRKLLKTRLGLLARPVLLLGLGSSKDLEGSWGWLLRRIVANKKTREKSFLDLVTLWVKCKNWQPYIQIKQPTFPLGYQEPILGGEINVFRTSQWKKKATQYRCPSSGLPAVSPQELLMTEEAQQRDLKLH